MIYIAKVFDNIYLDSIISRMTKNDILIVLVKDNIRTQLEDSSIKYIIKTIHSDTVAEYLVKLADLFTDEKIVYISSNIAFDEEYVCKVYNIDIEGEK